MKDDFFRIENKDYDLPFLNDDPRFTTKNVAILLIGFIITFLTPFFIPVTGNTVLKAVISFVAPMIPITYVFKDDMSNIFRMPKLRDILIIIVGVILTLILSALANSILAVLSIPPAADSAVNGSPGILFIRAIIQIFGEELEKFIPLIIVAAYLYKPMGRKLAIIIAIIISQLLFALSHIPAYGINNIIYIIMIMGISSVIMPIIYIRTKNLVITYFIHLIIDLLGFIPFFLAAIVH